MSVNRDVSRDVVVYTANGIRPCQVCPWVEQHLAWHDCWESLPHVGGRHRPRTPDPPRWGRRTPQPSPGSPHAVCRTDDPDDRHRVGVEVTRGLRVERR
jgi:hypothetical protein